jgi:hypothetical protein
MRNTVTSRVLAIALALFLAASPVLARDHHHKHSTRSTMKSEGDSQSGYINSKGEWVPSPAHTKDGKAPAGHQPGVPTAQRRGHFGTAFQLDGPGLLVTNGNLDIIANMVNRFRQCGQAACAHAGACVDRVDHLCS